jgi:glycosyltransferase involved in cell wall biosynthesis
MEKKNIAIVITRLDLGGAQQVALYLAKNLSRKKFNVHLICGRGGYLDEEAKKIKDLNLFFLEELIHPVNLIYDAAAYIRLIMYFEKNRIDIVHTHSSKAGLLGRLAAATAGNKPFIVHTIHGFPFHEFQNPVMHFAYLLLERLAGYFSGKLIAVGADVAAYGLKKGVGKHEKYVIIRAGIDLQKFKTTPARKKAGLELLQKHGLKGKTFIVAMIGNLKKQKNPMAFVEIAKKVVQKENDTGFVFAGDGPLMENVREALTRKKLNDSVKFIGWCDEPENLLAAADLYLLTSLWEGLPCTLVQAAVAGKPVIASDIDGNREFTNLTGCGALFTPHDSNVAAEKIIEVRQKKLKFRVNRASLRQFDLKYMLVEHEALYAGIPVTVRSKPPVM